VDREPFAAARFGDEPHGVGARGGEERGPEDPLRESQGDEQRPNGDEGIEREKRGNCGGRRRQHATLPEPIAERAGERRRERRREGQAAEKETCRLGRPAEVVDAIGRHRQKREHRRRGGEVEQAELEKGWGEQGLPAVGHGAPDSNKGEAKKRATPGSLTTPAVRGMNEGG
jgi:hypothetical protein